MSLGIKAKIAVWAGLALVLFGLLCHPMSAGGQAAWVSMDSGSVKNLAGLWGSDNQNVFAVGQAGTVLHFDGAKWLPQNAGSTQDLSGVWGIDGSDVFVVGDAGTALHYSGPGWKSISSDNSTDLHGVWGTTASNVLAVGQRGTILRYDGQIWNTLTSGTVNDLYGIWGSDSRNVFVVGQAGVILHSDNGTWTPMNSGTANDLLAVQGFPDGTVLAVGKSGTVLRYNGIQWNTLVSGISSDLHAVWGLQSSAIIMAGAGGSIMFYDGAQFSSLSRNTIRDLNTVWGASATDVFAVGGAGSLLRYVPPLINSISPTQGDQGQNLDITLTGINLSGANRLDLGPGISVNSYKAVNPNSIGANITIVAGTPTGSRDVTVSTSGGSFILTAGFSVNQAAPTISTISPAAERQGSNLKVTISGAHLNGVSEVSLGAGIAVNSYNLLSANQIAADITIAPDAVTGARNVTVSAAGGRVVLPGGFTVRQAMPAVTAVTPAQGNQSTTFNMLISGTNLSGATQIIFGEGVTVNNFVVLSLNQIAANISIAAGAAIRTTDVAVTTPGGDFVFPNSFSIKQALPTLTAITPQSGSQGATLVVTLNGANLNGTSQVRLGTGVAVNDFSILSASQIEAVITILSGTETGPRDVSVVTPGGLCVLPNSFTVLQSLPVITTISPESGNQGASVTVIISGNNLDGSTSVSFGAGVAVRTFTNLSSTQLRASILIDKEAATGLRDVTVTTAGGSSTLSNHFDIKPKSLGSLILVLTWIGVALVIGLFALVLYLLRKRRAARL